MSTTIPKVTIAGAGIAGLTAALWLLRRGFDVTLFEQSDVIGGMLRGYRVGGDEYYEHSYHMYVNWYYNFWQVVYDVGAQDNFVPRRAYKFLSAGEFPRMKQLVDVGSVSGFWRNLTSGVAPIPDMFLYLYSMIDLLSHPPLRGRHFLDHISVNGFMYSRPYATDAAAELHEKTWETVWALPSYGSSATSYQTFLKFGNRVPLPMFWLLKGNKYQFLMQYIENKLNGFGDRFHFHHCTRVSKLVLDNKTARISNLLISRLRPDNLAYPASWETTETAEHPIAGDLILAVTPGQFASLINKDIYHACPGLGDTQKVQTEPMAAVALYFNRRLPDIPNDVVVLEGAKYEMTFLDYSQLWTDPAHPEPKNTCLYVTVSDFRGMKNLDPGNPTSAEAPLNLRDPATALEYILVELKKFIPFEASDISLDKTLLSTDTGEELFANEVGSPLTGHRRPARSPICSSPGIYAGICGHRYGGKCSGERSERGRGAPQRSRDRCADPSY